MRRRCQTTHTFKTPAWISTATLGALEGKGPDARGVGRPLAALAVAWGVESQPFFDCSKQCHTVAIVFTVPTKLAWVVGKS